MRPITVIRRRVFEVSQAEFASIAGTTQSTVSRWEGGALAPDQYEMVRIRTEAQRRSLDWDDSWFFQVPAFVGVAE